MSYRHQILGLAAATALLWTGCQSSSSSPTAPAQNGQLAIRITDAPTDLLSALDVYVAGVVVKLHGAPPVKVAGELGSYDILQLHGTTRDLVASGVPAGRYDYVEVDLDAARSDVVDRSTGKVLPLQISNAQIQVLGGFTVPADGALVVTLDFKADQSLEQLPNGDWLLTPVIEATWN